MRWRSTNDDEEATLTFGALALAAAAAAAMAATVADGLDTLAPAGVAEVLPCGEEPCDDASLSA